MTKVKIEEVLTIGPDYHYPYGGIAKLINTYSRFFKGHKFNFIPTMRAPEQGHESKIKTLYRLGKALLIYPIYLLNPKIKIVHIHSSLDLSFF